MVQLPQKHPQLYAEFLKGNFVVQRSAHKFSLISKDQRSFETVLDTTTSGTARHHHHFICPIIKQYAHLREYGLEEQDSKVR